MDTVALTYSHPWRDEILGWLTWLRPRWCLDDLLPLPNSAMPCRSILFAANKSRWCTAPHSGQVPTRSLSVSYTVKLVISFLLTKLLLSILLLNTKKAELLNGCVSRYVIPLRHLAPNLSQARHHKVIACYRADVFATTEVAPPCGVGEQQEGVGYGVWGKGNKNINS